jgi:hypothetical protein
MHRALDRDAMADDSKWFARGTDEREVGLAWWERPLELLDGRDVKRERLPVSLGLGADAGSDDHSQHHTGD